MISKMKIKNYQLEEQLRTHFILTYKKAIEKLKRSYIKLLQNKKVEADRKYLINKN